MNKNYMGNEPKLEYLAELSRIRLTEEEYHEFQGQLESILEYMQELNEVNTDEVMETSHVISLTNQVRKDEVYECEQDIKKRLLDDERVDDNYFVVKKVL